MKPFTFRAVAFAALLSMPVFAQRFQEPGKSIGRVRVQGDLIVMTLDQGAVPKENLFDLAKRTVRFIPDSGGYRVENAALQWDADFGNELSGGSQVTLRNFEFPYSGKSWNSFFIGNNGTIVFGAAPSRAGGGQGGGGFSVGRFDQLRDAAGNLVNTVPAIAVFLKPRTSGPRYVKELADKVVITWNLTEAYAGIQDFSWTPTINRFQAVLAKDGSISFSYDQLNARDAIVGLYPLVNAGKERPVTTLGDSADTGLPPHVDVKNITLTAVDELYLKVALELSGPAPSEAEAASAGLSYRISFDVEKPYAAKVDSADADVVWTIRAFGGRGPARYMASGPGLAGAVKREGNTLTIQGALPPAFRGVGDTAVFVEAQAGETRDAVGPKTFSLGTLRSPSTDLSALTRKDGPFQIIYEAFHYMALPGARDMTCTVLKALGDKFDFLIYYSDFRVDNQEAGTPSTGPLGGNVTGIGHAPGRPEAYGRAGRFQWQYVQRGYIGSNQGQAGSPEGVKVDRAGGGGLSEYQLAMSQVGHELGHRWSAFVSALVKGERIPLGPTHWARGLHAPAAFPYRRTVEASAMGGGVWQDNFDGTFTQLDDDYYVPPTGWSHLELYLMGLATPAAVPDFFLLRNLQNVGKDALGRPIVKADRVKITIADVIAAEGPRNPPADKAQKDFNTGFVVMTAPGQQPSKELLERTNAIREKWIEYWVTTTGHRSRMTTTPR